MIDNDEIVAKADEFGIEPSDVQRDYVFGWLVNGLYENSTLADELVLKGGNALRKCYFPLTRFSDDLDFTTTGGLDADVLHEQFNTVCSYAEARSGVRFLTDQNRIDREPHVVDGNKRIHRLRLYFQDFSGNADYLTLKIKVDVTEFDCLHLPIQTRRLIHPYSDSSDCNGEVRVIKLEEALADKLSCLIQRRYSFDLFDLVYGVFINNELDVNRGELVNTFLHKSIFSRSPVTARDLLLGVPFESMKNFWQEIVCPRITLPVFEDVVALVKDGIAQLFAPFSYGADRLAGMFFPPALRNPILQAATDQTLLRLGYHGSVRLVEPYALAYKVRKDGLAREYFYGYDVTGGNSGPGIKAFVHSDVASLANTDIKFTPRFSIELAKAPGRTGASYFGTPFSRRGVRSPRRRTVRQASTPLYKVRCSYCGKTFTRKTTGARLNLHKDGYGNRCPGRTGFRVF